MGAIFQLVKKLPYKILFSKNVVGAMVPTK
jgi:hypothetical protein